MTASTDLGARLRKAREEHGWTLREAQRRSGVPNAHISQVETGAIRSPGNGILIRLGEAYGIPVPELLALAGTADFGVAGEDGRLEDYDGHDLWTMAVWLPKGREGEAAAWMSAHGLEVYRMWQPEAAERRLQRRWTSKKCRACGLYGWQPGDPTGDPCDERVPATANDDKGEQA